MASSRYGTKKPKSLGEALNAVLSNLGIQNKIRQYAILDKWAEIVGEKVASVTTAERIQDGILYVKVKNSAWRNELLFLKEDILEKLSHVSGQVTIRDIWFI